MSKKIMFLVDKDFESIKKFISTVTSYMSEGYEACGFDMVIPLNTIHQVLNSSPEFILLKEAFDVECETYGWNSSSMEFPPDIIDDCALNIDKTKLADKDEYYLCNLIESFLAKAILSDNKVFADFSNCVKNIADIISESYIDEDEIEDWTGYDDFEDFIV